MTEQNALLAEAVRARTMKTSPAHDLDVRIAEKNLAQQLALEFDDSDGVRITADDIPDIYREAGLDLERVAGLANAILGR